MVQPVQFTLSTEAHCAEVEVQCTGAQKQSVQSETCCFAELMPNITRPQTSGRYATQSASDVLELARQ